MRSVVLFVIAFGLPVPALAGVADFATRDPACAHQVTVQYLDCEVSVVYTCPAADGLAAPLYREEVFSQDGLHSYSMATQNGTPLVSADADGRVVIAVDPATIRETTLEEVMKTRAGTFSATGIIRLLGLGRPATLNVALAVTGKTQTISGIDLVEVDAEVSLRVPPPMGVIESVEKGYLMPDLGFYLTGETTGGTFFKADETPHRPMSLAMPGSPGFDTTKPAYCGGNLSLNVLPNILNGVL
jgi:hypothetical protein